MLKESDQPEEIIHVGTGIEGTEYFDEAIKCGKEALKLYEDYKSMATYISNKFNKEFAKYWHCVVGTKNEYKCWQWFCYDRWLKYRLGEVDIHLWCTK